MLMKRGNLHANGLRLAYVDFGGTGPSLLLLHGLFGRATTWHDTARWLTPHFRVVGLDQRGHGLSDKPDNDYAMERYAADAAAVIEQLGLGPAAVVGHSMGALVAWMLAAQRPDLVRGIVLEDMNAGTHKPGGEAWVRRWINEWPLPFPSMAAMHDYFYAMRPGHARYFAEVMTEREDGYRPLWQVEHMEQSSRAIHSRDYWAEIDAVRCPALVVKGGESECAREELQEMARRMPLGRYAEVAGAGHVVHCDQPEGWREAVEPFLLALEAGN